MKTIHVVALLFFPILLVAQQKPLEIADVNRWRKIEQTQVTANGQWVAYLLTPSTQGDNTLCLWNAQTQQTTTFERAAEPKFSEDGQYLVFKIKPPLDTLKAQRRRKVKDEDLPADTLGIYTLATDSLQKFPKVRSYSLPEKWSGWIAYQLEPEKPAVPKKETPPAVSLNEVITEGTEFSSKTPPPAKKKDKKPKKEDTKENGSRLVLRDLNTGREDTVAFVREYRFAKRGPALLLHSTGRDSGFLAGVYRFDCGAAKLQPLFRFQKGKFTQLALDDWGRQAAFLADTDTSKARIRPWQLCYWSEKQDSARVIGDSGSPFLRAPLEQTPPPTPPLKGRGDARGSESTLRLPSPSGEGSGVGFGRSGAGWQLSENARPLFSEDGQKLYFGIAPPPALPDTLLLPEEIVNVEVWAWDNNRLYTELEKRLDADKRRSYPVVYHLRQNKFVRLGSPELPEWRFQEQRDAGLALAFTEEPYAQYQQWEGAAHKDLYAVELESGNKKLIVKNLRCKPRLSPGARYILWWNEPDSAWFAWNARKATIAQLTDNRTVRFFDEESDTPDFPDEYGIAGWLNDDEALIAYDRFDLWRLDPDGKNPPQRLTAGRETQTQFRYIRLDPEERSLAPGARLLLHQFNKTTKAEGYAWLDLKTGTLTPWLSGDFAFSRTPLKAAKADALIFTRQNYQTFPDLLYTLLPSVSSRNPGALQTSNSKLQTSNTELRISTANPQQSEYRWGSIERIRWTSLSGEMLEGLLVKPSDFDPQKKYPLLINFYERLSDGVHQHRAPDIHRSTINFTMYASRGYLVFAPDIPYRTGYPGESAYNAIMSGVTALLNQGFVDPARVGLQGHSWGGYQAAYLITRTNMFACAEAGAAVVNMTSAYGGIRWETGVSRQFQYERQQSRIGGSLWEYPMRYLENSPLFSLDKVHTPLLIMHNDNDGAVPWQQGIEFFAGLRRLGKPSWMLNYNDEPHWPVKLQNRIDFQTRMQQFFDHYLMGAPKPRWMERGVPPIEKGILQGLEPGARGK